MLFTQTADGFIRLPGGFELRFSRRPKPQFRPGQLATLEPDAIHREPRYMLIQHRRWVKPNGEMRRRWVYDGPIVQVWGGKLVFLTYGSCFDERTLVHFHGIDWYEG